MSAQDEEYEFEDPGQAWVALVDACHLAALGERRKAVQEMIFEAKNSHWTMSLWEAEQEATEEDTTEYGGPFEQQEFPEDTVAAFSRGSDYVTQADMKKRGANVHGAWLKRPLPIGKKTAKQTYAEKQLNATQRALDKWDEDGRKEEARGVPVDAQTLKD